MAPYEHPYRYCLAAVWRGHADVRRGTVLAIGLLVTGVIGRAAGVELLGLVAGLGAMLTWIVPVLWLVAVAREGHALTRRWAGRSELGKVRARRPQAGEHDPAVLHDEFAVSVKEDGHLVTWRFRPLRVYETPDDAREVEIPGRPRYAASPMADEPFEAADAVRATEQLVAAQERAAALEAEAAQAAREAHAGASQRAELAAEAASTAAALQRLTGQRSRER
jgi:hypothetical protein